MKHENIEISFDGKKCIPYDYVGDIKVGDPDELTDEQKAQRIAPPITVTIKNPPEWLIEEMRDDQE